MATIHKKNIIAQVEIYISCTNLKDLDTFSKSDPLCIMSEYNSTVKKWIKLGQTEQIANELNPNFQTSFTLNYFQESEQKIKFEVVDVDDVGGYDAIGEVFTTMSAIMTKKLWESVLTEEGKTAERGTMQVRGEYIQASTETAMFQMRWENLNNWQPTFMGFCYDFMPMRFEISKKIPNSDNFALVYHSNLAFGTQHPHNPIQEIAMQVLCNSDRDRFIKFSAIAISGKVINSVVTTINELENNNRVMSGKAGAKFALQSLEIEEKLSYLGYINRGWKVGLVAAIDFTASNGDPKLAHSNHCIEKDMNDYEKALYDVGKSIEMEGYDAENWESSIQVFGFGGIPRYMGMTHVNDCFALNGDPYNPEIIGIQNVLETYRNTVLKIDFAGPTHFGPLLDQFKKYMESIEDQLDYKLLLILTDGTIHDMPRTKQLIVALSALPCSIIIVGIGTADFSAMEELDGEDGILRDDAGRRCEREIVQFVEYSASAARGDLANQIMKEVPDQVCSYMERRVFKEPKRRISKLPNQL